MNALIPLLALLIATATSAADANWPQFRGPGSRGVADSATFPDRWSASENVAWKAEPPGRGWSSPVVWGERVFLTTVVNQGTSEPPKKGLYFGGNRPEPSPATHEWKVLCLDLKSGKQLWDRTVHRTSPATPIHLKNSYASETPVTDGQHVYAAFGNVGLFCFNFIGDLVWSNRFEALPTRFGWGTASSPVLHGDRLYLVNDNDKQSELLAFDKRTGKPAWRVSRDEKSNWATPFVWEHDQRTEIILPATGRNCAYDLEGNELWSFKGMSSITIATPYTDGGLLYLSSGYVGDKAKPLYAIRPGAKGDITLPAGQTSGPFIAWSDPVAAPYNPTTLVYQGLLYVLHDRGLVSCYDAQTGQQHYDRERLPNGFAFTASPWAAQGRIYCLNEDGVAFVIKAGKTFQLLHTNRLTDDDMCMATPAIAGDRLLIRTATRVYCIRTGKQP